MPLSPSRGALRGGFCQPRDPGLTLVRSHLGLGLASKCSQWADQIGSLVSFIYLQSCHRNLLVPTNCLLALSEPGSCCVHKHNNVLFCLLERSGPHRVALPSLTPLGYPLPCTPPPTPGIRRGSLSSAASPVLGTPNPSSSWLPPMQVPSDPLL